MKRLSILCLGLLPLVLMMVLFYGAKPVSSELGVEPSSVLLDGPVTVTMGTNATFTATVLPANVELPLDVDWTADGQAPVSRSVNATTDTLMLNWALPGTYTVEVQAANTVGGPVIVTRTIEVLDVPIAGLLFTDDTPVMIGEEMHFVATVTAGTNVIYAWEFGDGTEAVGPTASHTYTEGGTFDVEVVATNTAGSVSKEDEVEVLLPALTFGTVMNGVGEGDGTVTMTVELSEAVTVDVSVDYATADSIAAAGSDYVAASDTLTITAGQTEGQISVDILDDVLDEVEESFRVELSNPVHASTVPMAVATVLISDDDDAPSVSIEDASITEGDSATDDMDFTVRLDAPSGRLLTVNYETGNSTAFTPDDFETTSGILTFDRGETEQTISVPVVGEILVEGTEVFVVQLTGGMNVVLSDTLAYGTIYDNDVLPTLAFASPVFTDTEQCEATGVEVQLSHAYPEAVTVLMDFEDGTATGDRDYVNDAVKVQFEPGETSTLAYVHICVDVLREDPESVILTLSDPLTATLGSLNTAVLWIQDATYQLYLPMSMR